jgi:diguanylate cyclase (GGDEF)-like protein
LHRQRGTPVSDYEGHAVACDAKDDGPPPRKLGFPTKRSRCHRLESETGRSHGWKLHLLSIQNDDTLPSHPEIESDSGVSSRRRQLAAAVAEHIRVTLASLGLRESLRLEAVRDALTDALTGLDNGRYMREFLDHQLHSARRKHRPLAVLMFDLDHFKQYNDKFGHSAGDKVMAAIGETLMRSVCAEDVACRYGGEEFVLILPECSFRQATVRPEEVRQRLQELHSDQDIPPTNSLPASVGVAAFDETDRVDRLLKFRRRSSLPSQACRPKPRRRGSPRGRSLELNFSDTDPLPIA